MNEIRKPNDMIIIQKEEFKNTIRSD